MKYLQNVFGKEDHSNSVLGQPLKTKMIVQSYDGELKATSCSELLSEVVCNGMLEIASEDAIEGAGDNGHNTLVLTDNLIQKCSRVTPEIRRLKRKRKYDKFVKDDPASTNSQEVAGTEHEPDLTQHCSSQKPDEYDLFAQHIAEQLRKLPTQRFIVLQDKIQRLVTSERIEHLSEVSEKCSSNVSSASPPQDERTEEIHHVWFNGHLYTKQKSRID
ncbi:hypothetical protein J6590_017377 [Homalodisca vitripennis]|nr:hypothetical protein J6590_017377 [Homalodisca vitripennis]